MSVNSIIGDVVDFIRDVFTPPPPPPPEPHTGQEIQALADQATSDPQERALLVDGYTQAQEQQDGALWQQTGQLATLYADREVLELSRYIDPVRPDGTANDPPEGWTRATPEQLADYGLTEEDLRPNGPESDAGFRAELFIPDPEVYGPDATPVVQFEGTNFEDMADVNADVAQAMGNDEEFYNRALDIATTVNERSSGEIRFGGHSLGGGMATAAGLATGAPTIVSNPAGVNPATVEAELAARGLDFEDADGAITTYVMEGDLLTELQHATTGLDGQNADSFAAILNGVGVGMNAYQDDVVFPTDVTGQQVQDLPDAVGTRVTLDARDEHGEDRPDITSLDSIVGDINDHVEAMPVDDFAGLVEDGADIVDDVTGVLGDVANGTGDVLNTVDDYVPGPLGDVFGGAGDVISGGGDVVSTMGDYVEEGGDITLDIAEGLETAGAVAIEAADGDVRDSVSEMVARHEFGAFNDAFGQEVGDREAALRDRLDS